MNRRRFFGSIAAIIAAPPKAWSEAMRARMPLASHPKIITGIPPARSGVIERKVYRRNIESSEHTLIATLKSNETHSYFDDGSESHSYYPAVRQI